MERDAVLLWLRRCRALIEAYVAAILSRYGVGSLEELKDAVRTGRVPEHSAWEDLIVLQRLLEEKRRVEKAICEIEGPA